MSDILVKGMEMPSSCGECLNIGWNYVFECDLDDVESGERRLDCPLAPVPPHGRLIDADELCDGRVSNDNVVICAKSAPTIIPAEEGE